MYKGKGPPDACANCRPISLLCVPGKIFAHLLLSRIDPLLRSKRRFERSSFTSGRSTLDALLALRLLSEVLREVSQSLHVAVVDLKATSDSVDRLAFWKALRGIGIPQYLIHLMEDLHNGSTIMSGLLRLRSSLPVSSPHQVAERVALTLRLCSPMQLIASWNVLLHRRLLTGQ